MVETVSAGQRQAMEGDSERSPQVDRAFVEIALRISGIDDAMELRQALAEVAGLLSASDYGTIYALCEVSAEPSVRPVIAWQAGGETFGLAEDGNFAAWFARARQNPGDLEPLGGGRGAGLLWKVASSAGWESHAGLFVSGEPPSDEKAERLRAIVKLVALALGRVARGRFEKLRQRRLVESNQDALSWLELGVDIVWEATSAGVIRCRRIFNRRSDIAAAIEGRNLDSVIVGAGGRNLFDLLCAEGRVARLSARFDAVPVIEGQRFHVSGLRREADSVHDHVFVGTLSCLHMRTSSGFADEAATALTQVRASRAREEQMRIEAEAMLEGLRLLLAGSTSREKLARLTALLAEGIRASDAMIIEAGFDGQLRILAPFRSTLDASYAPIARTLARDLAETSLKLYGGEEEMGEAIRYRLGMEGENFLALALPLRSQSAYFLCASRGDFGPAAISFAERSGLLLRQALLLREEQAQLAQTAKMAALGQMSASIAHELKQPLNTISLATQNLEALLDLPNFTPAMAEAKIARVLAQVERASNVIDRMRRFGRKSIGDNEPVELLEMAEGVVAMIRHVTDHAGVEITFDIAPGLSVEADRLQIEQVLANLIQNAVDAISGVGAEGQDADGERAIRIAAMEADDGMMVELRVEDSGPGFPPGIIERVLEPFFTTKPAEQGTGLGLAICDAIVRESGGRLTLGNHARGGFVSLCLPRAAEDRAVTSRTESL